jgi:hypothetical protein
MATFLELHLRYALLKKMQVQLFRFFRRRPLSTVYYQLGCHSYHLVVPFWLQISLWMRWITQCQRCEVCSYNVDIDVYRVIHKLVLLVDHMLYIVSEKL